MPANLVESRRPSVVANVRHVNDVKTLVWPVFTVTASENTQSVQNAMNVPKPTMTRYFLCYVDLTLIIREIVETLYAPEIKKPWPIKLSWEKLQHTPNYLDTRSSNSAIERFVSDRRITGGRRMSTDWAERWPREVMQTWFANQYLGTVIMQAKAEAVPIFCFQGRPFVVCEVEVGGKLQKPRL